MRICIGMRSTILTLSFFFSNTSFAGINEYIYLNSNPSYSNYGTVGIIQNPSARFQPEGTLAFSWSHNEPYLRGSIIAYPFKFLEASFQYTDSNNYLYSEVKEFSGSQSHKDKSFDFKFMLRKEGIYMPQIAVGARDIAGTGRFGSEYLVLSKFVGNDLDITLGLGWGNLTANRINNPLDFLSNRFDRRTASLGLGGKFNTDDFFAGDAGFLQALNGLYLK